MTLEQPQPFSLETIYEQAASEIQAFVEEQLPVIMRFGGDPLPYTFKVETKTVEMPLTSEHGLHQPALHLRVKMDFHQSLLTGRTAATKSGHSETLYSTHQVSQLFDDPRLLSACHYIGVEMSRNFNLAPLGDRVLSFEITETPTQKLVSESFYPIVELMFIPRQRRR